MTRASLSRLPLPTRRRWRALIYLLSAAAVGLAADLVWVRAGRVVHPAADTTRWTAPLRENGSVDFIEALNLQLSEDVTPQNNAFAVMLPAIGVSGLRDELYAREVASRVGVSLPQGGDAIALVPIGLLAAAQPVVASRTASHAASAPLSTTRKSAAMLDPEAQLETALEGPWQPGERPAVSMWIDRHAATLELYHRASRCTRYYAPLLPWLAPEPGKPAMVVEAALPALRPQRDLARLACARALRRAGAGDWTSARADVLAVHRHARLAARGVTLAEYFAALGIEALAAQTGRNMLAGMPAPQARAMLADLRALPEMPGPGGAIDTGERAIVLDAVAHASRHGIAAAQRRIGVVSDEAVAPPGWLALVNINYDEALRAANGWYDRAVAVSEQRPYAARREAAARLVADAEALRLRGVIHLSRNPGELFVASCFPPVDGAHRAAASVRAELHVTAGAAAVAAYRSDQGRFPQDLSVAAGHLNMDPFVDAPLRLRVEGDVCLVYAVGPNLQDDGGTPRGQHGGGDDIVARIPLKNGQ